MPRFEYLTVPAPRKGEKAKGIKTPEARIALAMQSVLNEKGAEGWDYVRADLIPMEERAGLTSKSVNYHTVLVFRREIDPLIEEAEGRRFGAFPTDIESPETASPKIGTPEEAQVSAPKAPTPEPGLLQATETPPSKPELEKDV